MDQSLLIQTLRQLSTFERRALEQFLESPLAQRRAESGEALSEVMPVLDGMAPSSDKRTRTRHSFLFANVKRFLAWRTWQADPTAVQYNVCEALRTRGLERVCRREYATLSRLLERPEARSSDWHRLRYLARLADWDQASQANRAAPADTGALLAAFSEFVALETLRLSLSLRSHPNQKAAAVPYLDETLRAAAAGAYRGNPIVSAYYHALQLGSDNTEGHFELLRGALVEHGAQFQSEALRELLLVAINYCVRRLNAGDRSYMRQALDLYRTGLDRHALLEEGHLSKFNYDNIVRLALGLGEWQWAAHFLDEYRQWLAPADRESTWRYNRAVYFFRKGEFGAAQEILSRAEFRDVFNNLHARRMMAQIYLENGDLMALDNHLDRFAMFLQRKRATLGYHKQINHNFIRFMRRLLAVPPGSSAADLHAVIATTPYLAEREWLLAKTLGRTSP